MLLVGSPGVGKSSALLRCLVEYAKQELAKPEPERIPVLIRLKNYQGNLISSDDPTGMLALIKNALKPKFKRRIEISEIEEWLFEGRLILLLDGLNEMPSSSVRTQLQSFCEDLDQTSLICSTRELGAGDLGINRKLVLQPPDLKEIDRFLRECIPTAQVQKVESLLNRDGRELNRTPFVLWMLYHVIHETGTVADTLGEAFRKFFQSFKGRRLEAAPVTDDRRKAWDRWLKHLAFTMLSSPDPQDPGLIIAEEDAEAVLFKEFSPPHETPSLNELLKYHLLQEEKGKITFHHQLIQEYYAAEALRPKLDNLTDEELKCGYLNYLKWTEPIVLMLALIDSQSIIERVVGLTLEVDRRLGAKLLGEAQTKFHERLIRLLEDLSICKHFKIHLLELTQSERAERIISELYQTTPQEERVTSDCSSFWLGKAGKFEDLTVLRRLQDQDFDSNIKYAIISIQNRYKFYNYEIYQQAQALREQARQVKGEIDFAILTAISTERKAICEAFNITDKDRVRHDSRTYWRKRFPLKNGKFYEIVVAQCLDAGTSNAALLTNDTLHYWKPTAVLMVGIAAAAKPEQQLGNLVIGREVYYYETGAITAAGTLPEPKQIPVDATLLDRAQALPEIDFSILAAHPDGINTRPEIENNGVVIASGDKVIKDAAERDKIAAANRKIRAIEMEGYGVLNAAWQHFDQVRCLVIRALCDYADAAKNDQWHDYAAAVAAGYAHHYLSDEPLTPRNTINDL